MLATTSESIEPGLAGQHSGAPLASVVLPTRHRAVQLDRAIRGVFAQTYPKLELLVIDDCPEGCARDVVAQWKTGDSRIRYFRSDGRGSNAARNVGINNADGQYVAFLDDDDEFLPEKLVLQIGQLEDGRYEACYCGSYVVGAAPGAGGTAVYVAPQLVRKYPRFFLTVYNFIGTQTLVCTARALLAIGGFDEELRKYQDWDLAFRLARKFPIACVPRPLVRIHQVSYGRISTEVTLSPAVFYTKHATLLRTPQTLLVTFLYALRRRRFSVFRQYMQSVWHH
jgi:glycosyltransferase involved in cell wall biosynthesis